MTKDEEMRSVFLLRRLETEIAFMVGKAFAIDPRVKARVDELKRQCGATAANEGNGG